MKKREIKFYVIYWWIILNIYLGLDIVITATRWIWQYTWKAKQNGLVHRTCKRHGYRRGAWYVNSGFFYSTLSYVITRQAKKKYIYVFCLLDSVDSPVWEIMWQCLNYTNFFFFYMCLLLCFWKKKLFLTENSPTSCE